MKALPVMLVSGVFGGLAGGAIAYALSAAPQQVALSSGASAGPALDTSVSKAIVKEPEFDFGTMQRGATRSHEFLVKNTGGATLRLTAGDTSCKCTSFEVDRNHVPPGEEVHVRLEWIARSIPGQFRQTANLETNDPLRPMIQLSVSGDVVEPAGMEPASFALGEISSGQPASTSVLFFSTTPGELRVEATPPAPDGDEDLYEIAITPVDRSELPNPAAIEGRRITLTAKPGVPVGPIMEWVTIQSNLPDSEKLDVPVTGRVVGEITVHGTGWNEDAGVLHLGMVRQDTGDRRRLLLSVKGEHAADTRFEVAKVDPPELKVEVGETRRKSDDVYHTILNVEVPPGTRPMVHLNNDQGDDGQILLKTTHPNAKEMNLRVRFAVVQ